MFFVIAGLVAGSGSGSFELVRVMQQFGPQLGRPHVDTLKDSKHATMKELRSNAEDGAWRFAFAFDTKRDAILLVAGDKSGGSQKRFAASFFGWELINLTGDYQRHGKR